MQVVVETVSIRGQVKLILRAPRVTVPRRPTRRVYGSCSGRVSIPGEFLLKLISCLRRELFRRISRSNDQTTPLLDYFCDKRTVSAATLNEYTGRTQKSKIDVWNFRVLHTNLKTTCAEKVRNVPKIFLIHSVVSVPWIWCTSPVIFITDDDYP